MPVRIGINFSPTELPDVGALRGAQAYCREQGIELAVFPVKHGIYFPLHRALESLDGFITKTPTLDNVLSAEDRLRACGWFGAEEAAEGRPQVNLDHFAAGQAAAQHLAALGLQRFVYVHNPLTKHSWDRFNGFRERLKVSGFEVHEFLRGERMPPGKWTAEDQLQDLVDFLPAVEAPFGLYAYDDAHGLRAVEAAQAVGLRVPEDVAVVVTSASQFACAYYTPALTTVVNSMRRQGYEAVRLLVERLRGETDDFFRACAPDGVVVRESTRVAHASDMLVARALQWLRSNPLPEWKVATLAKALGCSQMTLQRRFRTALDTTPKSLMQRMRLDAACRELVDTEDDFTDIAHRCGFADSAHFSRSLRESTGLSPSEYRTRMAG